MATINSLLAHLDERAIAQRIGIRHDEARLNYHLRSNTVTDFEQFRDNITDYYNYHYTSCISNGGGLSPSEAYGRAKELLDASIERGVEILSQLSITPMTVRTAA